MSSAAAQPRFPCAADIKKVCAKVDPGEGRIGACIKENLKDLSSTCKDRLSRVAAADKACREDVKKRCGSVRKAQCLMDAFTDLGDACKAAIAAVVARKT